MPALTQISPFGFCLVCIPNKSFQLWFSEAMLGVGSDEEEEKKAMRCVPSHFILCKPSLKRGFMK